MNHNQHQNHLDNHYYINKNFFKAHYINLKKNIKFMEKYYLILYKINYFYFIFTNI